MQYIHGLVREYESVVRAVSDTTAVPEEVAWATDVLDAYFAHVQDARIENAKRRFLSCRIDRLHIADPLIPRQVSRGQPPVAYEQFLVLCQRRKSVRWFRKDKKVPRTLLDQAVRAASQAPSACNRQPFMFRIFDDPDAVQSIVSVQLGGETYAHTIPVFVVIIGKLANFVRICDRHLIYVDSALAAMNFMLALETVGLASCCVHWPDIPAHERALSGVLRLRPDEKPVLCLAVGYPDESGRVAYSSRKPLVAVRTYNE